MFILSKAKFVHNFLPPRLRNPKHLAWVKVMVWHVFELWNELYNYFNLIVLSTDITIQTDVFQTYLRTIYPNVGTYKVYIKSTWESIPQNYNKYLGEHQIIEFDAFLAEAIPTEYDLYISERNLEFDYLVIFPLAYANSLISIEALLKKYKPAGKNYKIIFENIT